MTAHLATLLARELTVTHGRRPILTDIDLTVAPGHRIGVVGPERRGQVDAAAGAGRHRAARARHGHAGPARRRRGLPAPGARAAGRRDGRRLPGPPHRRGRRRPPSWTPPRRRRPRPSRAPTTATPPRSSGGWPSAAPTSTPAPARRGPTSACPDSLLDRPMTTLSGGQAARAELAATLLSRFDVFLLDEPTNDLDLDGLDRLEAFVLGLGAGLVVVSHDRAFLERTVTSVLEIDEHTTRPAASTAGWQAYRRRTGGGPPPRRGGVRRRTSSGATRWPSAAAASGRGRATA